MHISTSLPETSAATVVTRWDSIEAHGRLVMIDQRELAEMCCEAHKDFNGVKGRWMLSADHSLLTTWWFQHFRWSEGAQMWEPTQPFQEW